MGIDIKFGSNALVVPEYDGQVILVQNPVIQKKLSILRDKNTKNLDFYLGLKDIGYLLTEYILSNLVQCEEHTVATPLGNSTSYIPKGSFYAAEILRAGRPFAKGGLKLIDELGLERRLATIDAKRRGESGDILNRETGKFTIPIEILRWDVPDIPDGANILVYDPMLATASSLIAIMDRLAKIPNVRLGKDNCNVTSVNLVAVPYGLEELHSKYPHLRIITAAIDTDGKYKGLDENAYIRPGLGDAGDRSQLNDLEQQLVSQIELLENRSQWHAFWLPARILPRPHVE